MMGTRVHPTKVRRLLISVLAAAGFLALSLILIVQTARAQTGDIEGTVTYYGNAFGNVTVQLAVFTTADQPLPPPVATAGTTTDIGTYRITAVEDGAYFVFAYLDVNNNSQPDAGVEPFAWYDYEGDGRPDVINVLGGTTADIDILLTDLWRPLGGPLGQVNSIVAQPGTADTLYAAVGHPYSGKSTTLYKSTDGAGAWAAVYTDTSHSTYSLAVTGTLVYAVGEAADGKSAILRSQDAGTAWTQVFTGDGGAFRSVAINPGTTNTAYIAGVEQGNSTGWIRSGVIYRTHSGGVNWTRVLTVPEGDLHTIAINPVTPTIVYAGGYTEEAGTHVAVVYRSANSGATWSVVLTDTDGAGQQFTSLAVHPMTPTLIYAGSQTHKAVYRAEDGGLTPLSWTKVITDRGFRLALDPPGTVYAADDWRELAGSFDNGDTWTRRIGEITPDVMQALALDTAAPTHALYIGTRGSGVYRSDDGGLTWNAKNSGIVPTTSPRDIALDQQNRERLFVATGCDGGWRTIDGGQTWERQLSDCVQAFAVHPQDSFIVYAGIAQNAGKAIERSSNGGDTFSSVYTGTVDIDVLAIATANPNVVLAGGRDGSAARLLQSTDNGLTWDPVFTLSQGAVTALAIHPADATIAYAGVTDGRTVPAFGAVYRTTNGGATWTPVYATSATAIHSLVIDQKVPTTVYATDDQNVLKSVDGGTTWVPIHTYAEINRNLLAIDPRLADHLYLVGPGYIAETINGGVTWSDWMAPINQGTEGQTATALVVDRGGITQTLYAGFSGTWFYTRPSPQTSDFTTERVRGGLLQPTAIDWAPNGQMFIAHQDGRVLVDTDGVLTTFIDLSDEVNNNWNRGLIGIEVHPSFPISPYIYLLYTYDPPELPGFDGAVNGKDGNGARVSRLVRVTADPAENYAKALTTVSPTVILGGNSTIDTLGDPADAGGEAGTDPACTNPDGSAIVDCMASEGPSHSVGWLEFGHDGNLWVTNGEGAPYITPDARAARSQDLDSLGGKILRIDPETGEGVPGNPYYDPLDPGSNRSRVWARGLRNPFRFALHPVSDTIYVGDVGWYAWEELNYGAVEMNFGWPCYEGGAGGNVRHSLYEGFEGTAAVCRPLYDAEPDNGIEAPLYAYQNIAGAAIVAGDFYTGTRYPSIYQGALFIADYDKRTIKYLTFDGSGAATVHPFLEDISSVGGPVQLTLGPDGYFYYVALNPDPSGESEIRRVLYTSAPSVHIDATPRYGYTPLTVHFTRTLSSATDQLDHKWTFGDGGTSTEIAPVHTYAANGAYTAILTVTTPQGKSSHDRIFISVGNVPPVVTITTPLSGSIYTISTTLTFSGEARDPDTGPVPSEDLHWKALWFFNGHLHPAFTTLDGVASGQFVVPAHNDNTTMVLCLTASDNIPELQDPTSCVELLPQTAPYTFISDPAGYQLDYEGIVYTAPFTIAMMVNAPRTISAPPLQQGLPFVSWSDGGAAAHIITGQPTPQTLTALYRLRTWLPLILRGATP